MGAVDAVEGAFDDEHEGDGAVEEGEEGDDTGAGGFDEVADLVEAGGEEGGKVLGGRAWVVEMEILLRPNWLKMKDSTSLRRLLLAEERMETTRRTRTKVGRREKRVL